jgi:LuxR family maltose regulon positive regulatory protein
VPEDVLRTQRQLYRQFAQLLIGTGQFDGSGQFDAAEAVLRYLEQTTRDDPDLQGEIAVLRAGMAQNRGDYPHAVELSKKALSLLAPINLRARGRASYLLGFIQRERGLFGEAEPLLTQAYEAALQSGDEVTACASATYLAALVWERGRLRRADELWRQAIAVSENYPIPRILLGRAVLYEWNDLEAAARQQQRVIELSGLSGSLDAGVMGYFLLAMTRLAQGDIMGATAAAEKSDELAQVPGVGRAVRARHAAYRVLFAIWQDDPAATEHWRFQLSEYADALPFGLRHIPYRVLIARGEKAAAIEQLEALCQEAAPMDNRFVLINARICQSLAAATPAAALAFLTEALKMGQPEGFIRTFVDEGRLLAPLLRKALAQGISPEYTARLLNIIGVEERQRRAQQGAGSPAPRSTGLVSERELEVLRLVAEGLSNRQIADRLTVSLGTAKTHVHRVFEKLNATDRLQAVVRARELKLI